jgi:hypothetical protein
MLEEKGMGYGFDNASSFPNTHQNMALEYVVVLQKPRTLGIIAHFFVSKTKKSGKMMKSCKAIPSKRFESSILIFDRCTQSNLF